MPRIYFTHQEHYEFALQFLTLIEEKPKANPTHREIEIANSTLAKLFLRIEEGQKAVILPSYQKNYWLLTAPNDQKLDQALNRLQRFLVPTYASFGKNQVPILHQFGTSNHTLQQLGARLYPAGYYVFQSNKTCRQDILNALDLWIQLEIDEPQSTAEDKYIYATYGKLYEDFQLAISTAQWDEADDIRRAIRIRNLTTAENQLFLEIEQLAQQQHWSNIWNNENYRELAGTRIPRPVRGALLTAFHHTLLLPKELKGNWKEALETFEAHLSDLGLLLTSRLGFAQAPIVQTFAYQAASDKDRTGLLDLIKINKSQQTLECVTQLLNLLGPETKTIVIEPKHSPFSLAREALDNANYDAASGYASQVEFVEDKVFLLLQIAFHSFDMARVEEALSWYERLSAQQEKDLIQRFPLTRHLKEDLQKQIDLLNVNQDKQERHAETQPPITNWIMWFERLQTQSDAPELETSLGYIQTISDGSSMDHGTYSSIE